MDDMRPVALSVKFAQCQLGIVVLFVVGDIFIKPIGSNESFSSFFTSEFYLGHDKRCKRRVKDIQLDGECVVFGRCGETFLKSRIA